MHRSFEKREIVTFFLTLGIWITFLIIALIVKIDTPKPEYPLIELTLNDEIEIKPKTIAQVSTIANQSLSTTKMESDNSPKATKASTNELKTSDIQPVVEKNTSTKPAEKVSSTKAPSKVSADSASNNVPKQSSTASKPVVQQNLVQSMESLMAENTKVKKEVVWDDSVFENSNVNTSSSKDTGVVPKITTNSLSGFSGSAATSSKDSGSTASSNSNNKSSSSTSSFTKDALAAINGNTIVFSNNSTGSVQETSGEMSQDSDGINFELQDGSKRRLLQPSEPVINISEENEKLLKGSVQVTILFTVSAQGVIPLSSIEIQPAGLLPIEIQNEIKTQIKGWLFEEKKSDGHAYLNYSIKKE